MTNSSAGREGGAMGLWGVADSGLHAQCLRRKDFLGSTLAVRKGDLKVFGLMFHAFSIAHLLSSRYRKTVFRLWS